MDGEGGKKFPSQCGYYVNRAAGWVGGRFHIFQNFIVKCTRSRETRILANGHDTLAACPKACPHLSPPVSTYSLIRHSSALSAAHTAATSARASGTSTSIPAAGSATTTTAA